MQVILFKLQNGDEGACGSSNAAGSVMAGQTTASTMYYPSYDDAHSDIVYFLHQVFTPYAYMLHPHRCHWVPIVRFGQGSVQIERQPRLFSFKDVGYVNHFN